MVFAGGQSSYVSAVDGGCACLIVFGIPLPDYESHNYACILSLFHHNVRQWAVRPLET